jgi:sugar/nucleoside kinase (ribokinase family)
MISLNRNEAEILAQALNLTDDKSDEDLIRSLLVACEADELVIHRTRDALVHDGFIYEKCDTFFCEDPAILTGGGDNFNAGYCFARCSGFDFFESLMIANAVSGYYVKFGDSLMWIIFRIS